MLFFYYFINVFAKNYLVVNCLIELIRFIVYNVTSYISANFSFLQIPLKWPRYFPPVGARGPPWDSKNYFAIVICDEYYTLYIYTLTIFKKQIPPQKKTNTVSKWRPMTYFVSHHLNFGKNMKKHFSKGVFQWNLSHGFSGKSYFPASPKCWFMLISEKTTGFVC